MHGIVHAEFRRYAIGRLGPQAWAALLAQTGAPDTTYAASRTYPDEELLAQVLVLARATGEPVDQVLVDFGRAIVPGLLETYGAFVERTWGIREVLENVERVIHRTVRLQNPQATPPYLTTWRDGDEVVLHYTSQRRLCAFGKGLIHGLAGTYGESAAIYDEACMHRGDDACVLRVAIGPLDAAPDDAAPSAPATGTRSGT